MTYTPINFAQKLSLFSNHWTPKSIGTLNNYQFKLAKIKGEFVWHKHDETDEAFIVVEGEMEIQFRDGSVHLSKGEMFIVPKGVEHKPVAAQECAILLIEPEGTINTGTTASDLKVDQVERI